MCLSLISAAILIAWSVLVKKIALERVNCCTASIRALKHELNRGIKDVEVEYCPWCGGEIREGKE